MLPYKRNRVQYNTINVSLLELYNNLPGFSVTALWVFIRFAGKNGSNVVIHIMRMDGEFIKINAMGCM